ncbi:MAG: 30S ribosomal protein S19e [Thaumarchaeota archaeon]|nr:MAG: 30S ribosomal protein S19e [Nitrososphaerota archaeon]
MAKAYDVPADILINKLSEILKGEDIAAPSWVPFVKTGAHAEKPPQKNDWWYTRCASLLRKIYLHGPVGVKDLRGLYGGAKAVGYGGAHHRDSGGAIIRTAIHNLEKLGYLDKVEGKGRTVSHEGMKKIDRVSTEILNELIAKNPSLKKYS